MLRTPASMSTASRVVASSASVWRETTSTIRNLWAALGPGAGGCPSRGLTGVRGTNTGSIAGDRFVARSRGTMWAPVPFVSVSRTHVLPMEPRLERARAGPAGSLGWPGRKAHGPGQANHRSPLPAPRRLTPCIARKISHGGYKFGAKSRPHMHCAPRRRARCRFGAICMLESGATRWMLAHPRYRRTGRDRLTRTPPPGSAGRRLLRVARSAEVLSSLPEPLPDLVELARDRVQALVLGLLAPLGRHLQQGRLLADQALDA